MKKYIFVLILLNFGLNIRSQSTEDQNDAKRPMNYININFFQLGNYFGVDYGHIIQLKKPKHSIILGGGIGYTEEFQLCIFSPCTGPPETYSVFSHYSLYNFGNKFKLNIGFGGALIGADYNIYPIVGFMIHPYKSNITFNIKAHYPILKDEYKSLFMPIGVAIGIAF